MLAKSQLQFLALKTSLHMWVARKYILEHWTWNPCFKGRPFLLDYTVWSDSHELCLSPFLSSHSLFLCCYAWASHTCFPFIHEIFLLFCTAMLAAFYFLLVSRKTQLPVNFFVHIFYQFKFYIIWLETFRQPKLITLTGLRLIDALFLFF